MSSDNLDDIFTNSFLKNLNEDDLKKKREQAIDREIILKKRERLSPVINFLKKFVNIGLEVRHKDTYSLLYTSKNFMDAVDFKYDLNYSSKKLSPGVSIYIENPASIEIGVIFNDTSDVFVVNVSSQHPDAGMFANHFHSVDSLCKTLALFLKKNVVSVRGFNAAGDSHSDEKSGGDSENSKKSIDKIKSMKINKVKDLI